MFLNSFGFAASATGVELVAFAMLWGVVIFCVVAIIVLAKNTFSLVYGIRYRYNSKEQALAQKILKKTRVAAIVYFILFTAALAVIKIYPMLIS